MVRRWSLLVMCLATGLFAVARAAWCADNLVFVPLQPCRVIDTRVSGAGGPLAAGTPRSFFFRGPTRDYATSPNQGGSATGCGIPDLTSDSSPFQNIAKAVAINIVAVGPAGPGDLRGWPANQTAPNASVINYAVVSGLNIANGVIVPMCDEVSATPCAGGDITFRADVTGTHLVVDVVGYFHAGSPSFTLTNTALGHAALAANRSGRSNTATGALALAANTAGSYNTSCGASALRTNTTGVGNTASGSSALRLNNGDGNTASGAGALERNTTGSDNTASGLSALNNNTTGAGNTASGYRALAFNVTGSRNTATGASALFYNSTGYRNTADGYKALYSNLAGTHNTAIGYGALTASTGSHNIALGNNAGANLTTGDNNIDIAAQGAAGESATIRIGIPGTQTETHIAGIRGVTTGSNDAVSVLIDSNGQLGTVSSSVRFKEDIHELGQAAERVLQLRPVRFRYKKPFANGEKPVQYGLIAEEVEKVFPELVVHDKDGRPETVKYQVLPTLLLSELEKEHAELETASARLLEQERLLRDRDTQFAALLARIEALEKQSRAGTVGSPESPAAVPR